MTLNIKIILCGWLVVSTSLASAKKCKELREFEGSIRWSEDLIRYWFDGFVYRQGGLNRQGYLAILLKHKQTENSFVEKVLLTNEQNRIIEARYFEGVRQNQRFGLSPILDFQ